jgi:predicted MPP superfamily phosphohydrolase
VFHTYLTIAYLYVLARFVYPLPLSKSVRVAIAVLLLLVSKYHYWSLLIYGNMWSPELPFYVVLVLGWLFCAFVLLVVFVLISDFALMAMTVFRRGVWFVKYRVEILKASLLGAVILGGFGVQEATKVPEVRRLDVNVEGLPADLEGFRIVQLTDLHISRLFPESWTQRVVNRTNSLSADLILISGDLIDGYVQVRGQDVAPLAQLKAVYGVIGTPGNHEYYFDYPAWKPVFEGLGIRMLNNEHVRIQKGAAGLTIAGVTDDAALSYGLKGPSLQQALQGRVVADPVVLLSHRPQGALTNAESGVQLQLSGHTHGGMIFGLAQIAAYANEGFISREYNINKMKLYVSNGTGLWMGFPIRLGVPSEITEFTLRSASRGD